MDEMICQFGVELKRVSQEDLEMIRQWRNHPDVSRYMFSSELISEQRQREWFDRICLDNQQQHYVIYYKGEAIGVINGHSLNNRALQHAKGIEVGMYLAPECRFRGTVLAFCPALAFNQYCFEVLGCHYLQAEVLPDNQAALRFNRQLGYEMVSERPDRIILQLQIDEFEEARQQLSAVLRF